MASSFDASTFSSSFAHNHSAERPQPTDSFVDVVWRAGKQTTDKAAGSQAEIVAVMKTVLPLEQHLPDGKTLVSGGVIEHFFFAPESALVHMTEHTIGADRQAYEQAIAAVRDTNIRPLNRSTEPFQTIDDYLHFVGDPGVRAKPTLVIA